MWSKTYSPQIIELAASIHAATKQAQSNKPWAAGNRPSSLIRPA
jgi:hypothetical protein